MQDDEPDNEDRPFEPDWISPPHESVRDCLDENNISVEQFRMHMGWGLVQSDEFFEGLIVIDQSIADRLASVTGAPSAFWMKRQQQYTEKFNKIKAAGAEIGLEILGESELKNPQMLEIFIYENRKGHHCIVTKKNGTELRSRIEYRFRHELHCRTTLDILHKTLDLLTGMMEQVDASE